MGDMLVEEALSELQSFLRVAQQNEKEATVEYAETVLIKLEEYQELLQFFMTTLTEEIAGMYDKILL